ncbi:MAG: cupin domain-containing protein [Vitreimonas sp.]
MAATREMLTEYFFRGDSEAAGCLFERTGDNVALHVPGGAQRNPLLSVDWWPHIATLLDNHDIGPFEFDVIQSGTAIHTRALLDAKSHPSVEAIDKALRQGATLRVYGVSRFESHCASQLQLLRQVLKREAFVNLYLTPAQSPGLQLHYDLEDSLVVQVKGEKLWKLHEVSGPRYPRELSPGPPTVHSEPAQMIHMRAGDVLFVPSGLAHTVETRESASQHVTFGVHVSRQVSLLAALLDQFAAGEEELRRPVRSDETVSREHLASWAARFERWLRGRT